MINSLLTSPRPGGAPGTALPGMGGSVVGGLAGVASTHKGHGIRRYADQDEYQKWEFYYDFGKEMSGQGRTAATTAAGTASPTTGTPSTAFGGSGGFSFGTPVAAGRTPPAARRRHHRRLLLRPRTNSRAQHDERLLEGREADAPRQHIVVRTADAVEQARVNGDQSP